MQETRLQRVNSEIKKALASILAEDIRDPRIQGIISVVSVNTTNDLSHCTIYVSIYEQDKAAKKLSFNILQHSAGFIRRLLSQKVDLRITPELHFKLDEGYDNSEKMTKLIDSLNIPAEEDESAK